MKVNRERYEATKIKNILSSLNEEEEDKMENEVDEIVRLGPYEEGKDRPVKIKLKSQTAADEILKRAHKLKHRFSVNRIEARTARNPLSKRNYKYLRMSEVSRALHRLQHANKSSMLPLEAVRFF